jgi:hypothetical protein
MVLIFQTIILKSGPIMLVSPLSCQFDLAECVKFAYFQFPFDICQGMNYNEGR